MKKDKITRFFVFWVILCFALFLFKIEVREIYPSVILPDFRKMTKPSELRKIKDFDLIIHFNNGDSLVMDKFAFFDDIIIKSYTMITLECLLSHNKPAKTKSFEIGKIKLSLTKLNCQNRNEVVYQDFLKYLKQKTLKHSNRKDAVSFRIIKKEMNFSILENRLLDSTITDQVTFILE